MELQIIDIIKKIAESDDFAIRNGSIGIRGAYKTDAYKVNGKAKKSYVWIDGNHTNKRLNGTCAVAITTCVEDFADDKLAKQLEIIEESIKKVKGYGDGSFVLLFSKKSTWGDDDFNAEIIMTNAKVLAIF